MNKSIKRNILFTCLISLFSFTIIGCSKTEEKVKNSVSVENYQLELKNGTRFFKSEITPYSEAEKVILDTFKIEISDTYDEFTNLFADSEEFNYYPKIYKENLDNGKYTENITIHSLKKLSKDEYSNNSNTIQNYPYIDGLNKYNPYEFEIIEVNYTVKLTDKANKDAQWGNGDWIRYYFVVKQKEKSNFRIFDIYGHM